MTQLQEIEALLRPEPLDKDTLDKYYVDLSRKRAGNHIVKALSREISKIV